ncbi:hypothetical protein BDW62DRAFT_196832 [Aspergillus aurantiobrunneus]
MTKPGTSIAAITLSCDFPRIYYQVGTEIRQSVLQGKKWVTTAKPVAENVRDGTPILACDPAYEQRIHVFYINQNNKLCLADGDKDWSAPKHHTWDKEENDGVQLGGDTWLGEDMYLVDPRESFIRSFARSNQEWTETPTRLEAKVRPKTTVGFSNRYGRHLYFQHEDGKIMEYWKPPGEQRFNQARVWLDAARVNSPSPIAAGEGGNDMTHVFVVQGKNVRHYAVDKDNLPSDMSTVPGGEVWENTSLAATMTPDAKGIILLQQNSDAEITSKVYNFDGGDWQDGPTLQ